MLFTIDKIAKNSGKGSPVFSRQGLIMNQNHKVFEKKSTFVRPEPVEKNFNYAEWRKEMDEYESMLKFEKALKKKDAREKRERERQRLQAINAKHSSFTERTGSEEKKGPKKPIPRETTLFAHENVSVKLLTSYGASAEQRAFLFNKEKLLNKKRGVCMVSYTFCFGRAHTIQNFLSE